MPVAGRRGASDDTSDRIQPQASARHNVNPRHHVDQLHAGHDAGFRAKPGCCPSPEPVPAIAATPKAECSASSCTGQPGLACEPGTAGQSRTATQSGQFPWQRLVWRQHQQSRRQCRDGGRSGRSAVAVGDADRSAARDGNRPATGRGFAGQQAPASRHAIAALRQSAGTLDQPAVRPPRPALDLRRSR